MSLWALAVTTSYVAADTTNYAKLTFNRTGTSASTVTVSVVDADGAEIEGVTAELTSSSRSFKATKSDVTSEILCPNVNGNSSPTIELVFTVTGLDTSTDFNTVGLDIHALNSSGAYQSNDDGVKRQWNVEIENGNSTDSLSTFAILEDIDIADGIGTEDAVHGVWTATGVRTQISDPLVIQLTITKGSTNSGCYFGLSSIELSYEEGSTLGEAEAYYLRWYDDRDYYMTREADGSVVMATEDNTQRQFWGLEPTGNDNCYYIKNLATSDYIQSCNMEASTTSVITTGTEPVEYYVEEVTTSGSGVYGYYRLTSTDCDNYADASAMPVGLSGDESTSSVISWYADESRTSSYWMIEETENLYEFPQPFEYSSEVGEELYEYVLLSTSGLALTMDADGNLSWEERADDDSQSWYFVGSEENGFLIVNAATNTFVTVEGEDSTLWTVLESTKDSYYYFQSFDSSGEEATTLTVDGDSIVKFVSIRSSFARASQIYTYPCGATSSSYISKATIDGEGALKTLVYPLPTLDGSTVTEETAGQPDEWYDIYTDDKAILAIGKAADLNLSVVYEEGDELFAYYDWNRDGVFEVSQELSIDSEVEATIEVPEDASTGKTRIRLRLTANGLTDAEDDVAGETLDLVVYVTDSVPEEYGVTVTVNDSTRGTAEVVTATDGEAEVLATATGESEFVCWQEGNVVVSADANYSFSYDRPVSLCAYFSPNRESIAGVSTVGLSEASAIVKVSTGNHTVTVTTDRDVELVKVFTPAGQLVAESESKVVKSSALENGVYIVKVYLADDDVAQKVMMK